MTQDHPIQKLKNLYHLFQAIWANIRFGFPYRKLKIIAVTGSDGKTTTSSMIYHILKKNGKKVALISTIQAKIGEQEIDTGLHVTTPEPWDVPRYLKQMLDSDIEYVVLESTSNGLQQNRLWGIKFMAATITNIKSDHLDYHGTWENYAQAKFKVVEKLQPNGAAVLNADDEKAGAWLRSRLQKLSRSLNIIWYSKSDVQNFTQNVNGIQFIYQDQKFQLPVIGSYNLENALAAINISKSILTPTEIANALQDFPVPKGRMQIIQKEPFTIIIDFAHTPNALDKALNAVKKIQPANSKLICIFGCAGMRDKSRREMGRVAATLAEVIILTAEDPRNEKLADINDEILQHAEKAGGKLIQRAQNHQKFLTFDIASAQSSIQKTLAAGNKPIFIFDEDSIASREDAIKFALQIAQKGDIVFITGKAHEQSLAFGAEQTEYPWSDHDAVNQALTALA